MTPAFKSEARSILTLGLPLVGSNLAHTAMQLTDTLMLGWYDVTALAGVVLGGSLFFLFFIFGMGFGLAVTPMVAEVVEAGDVTRARRVTRMGLWISAVYGGCVMVPLFFSEALFRAIGQNPEVAAIGQNYLRIAGWQMVPALGVIVLRSFLSALERTQVILWVTLLTAALNVPLNWVLIFGGPFGLPPLGERGAAISTLVLASLSLLILLGYTARVARDYTLFQRIWKVDRGALAQVFLLGVPIGFTLLAEAGLFSASSVMMGWLGPVPLAAHGIALQLSALVFVIHLGLSQAATVRAGRAMGRHDEAALRQSTRSALWLAAGFAIASVLAFTLFPGALIGLFVDPSDPARPEILSIGVALLIMAALFHFVDAGQVMVLGLLRGVQDTTVPMWIASVSYWLIGLPVSYLAGFVLGWGGVGVWSGLVVGLTAAFVGLSSRYWGRSIRIGAGGAPAR